MQCIGIGTMSHGLPRFYNFSIGIRFLPYKSTLWNPCGSQTLVLSSWYSGYMAIGSQYLLDNSPRQWLNHQHKCYYHLKFKHIYTCTQKPGMNHRRQLWKQMVSNSCVISSRLLASILTIIVHMVWKSNLLQTSSIS